MSYSRERVNWTEEEHVAAENADRVYEGVQEAISNGVGPDDLATAVSLAKPSLALWHYLAGGSKEELADRLIDLGTMLKRDNKWLETAGE